MVRKTVRTRVHQYTAAGLLRARSDVVAGEEPLEIRINGEEFAVVMRTPGMDTEHVLGLLLAEGVITTTTDVREIDFSTGLDPNGRRNYNVARIKLSSAAARDQMRSRRNIYTSSACGVCGTSALEGVEKVPAFAIDDTFGVTPAQLLALPEALRAHQRAFTSTGGIHAAGLFSFADPAFPAGQLVSMAEDVGRHNAVDKVIGAALRAGLIPARHCVLQVSSRASYELVQKAAMAAIPVLSAVSAPSSAAVELGARLNVTVIGFNRTERFNAYSHIHRISDPAKPAPQ